MKNNFIGRYALILSVVATFTLLSCSKNQRYDAAVNDHQQISWSSMLRSDPHVNDSLYVDTTLYVDTIRTDTNNYSGIHYVSGCWVNDPVKGYIFRATFNVTNPLPLYAWVKVGTTWYGPVPTMPSSPGPGQVWYNSAWFNSLGLGLKGGCYQIRFTYGPNFYGQLLQVYTICKC